MKFIKKLFVLSIFALSLVLTGCLNFDDVKTLEFVQAPQSIYYLVGIDQAMEAQEEVLKDVTVKINGNVYTLSDAISKSLIQYEGLDLTTEGTKTLIVTLRENQNVRLTYVYKVVDGLAYELFAGGKGTKSDPYKIETPQQFMNIATKVYGTPAPSTTEEDDWKRYYNAVMPYFTNGVYFKITKDLDFTGIAFSTLGALGGENYVPFTGTIDGRKNTNQNYKISNLSIVQKGDLAAMFGGLNGATIMNIDFENVNVNSMGGKYASVITAGASEDLSDRTNLLYNINLINGSVTGPRAAGFATEATNIIFVKCNIGVNFRVIGLTTNSGMIIGALYYRDYSYSKAGIIGGAGGEVTWSKVRTLLLGLIPENEVDLLNIPVSNTTIYSSIILSSRVEGSILTLDKFGYYDPLTMVGQIDSRPLSYQDYTTSQNRIDSQITSSYEIFFTFNPIEGEPHQTTSVKGINLEEKFSLKYDLSGNVIDPNGIDNKIYLSYDIYGNPVESSRHFFRISGNVTMIKVYKDSQGNVVGFTESTLTKVDDYKAQ